MSYTVIRSPRIQGLPPRLPGSMVIRSTYVMSAYINGPDRADRGPGRWQDLPPRALQPAPRFRIRATVTDRQERWIRVQVASGGGGRTALPFQAGRLAHRARRTRARKSRAQHQPIADVGHRSVHQGDRHAICRIAYQEETAGSRSAGRSPFQNGCERWPGDHPTSTAMYWREYHDIMACPDHCTFSHGAPLRRGAIIVCDVVSGVQTVPRLGEIAERSTRFRPSREPPECRHLGRHAEQRRAPVHTRGVGAMAGYLAGPLPDGGGVQSEYAR